MSRFELGVLARASAWVTGQAEPATQTQGVAVAQPQTTSAVEVACALARRFEGLFLSPYLCPAGVPTIGYGATYYADGRRVQLTDPSISREAAERLLLLQVKQEYLPGVLRLCPGLKEASPNRLAAIIDFTFNLGTGNLASSTLRKKINAGDWEAVPNELRKWNKGGGKVLRGLVLRREAEAALV